MEPLKRDKFQKTLPLLAIGICPKWAIHSTACQLSAHCLKFVFAAKFQLKFINLKYNFFYFKIAKCPTKNRQKNFCIESIPMLSTQLSQS